MTNEQKQAASARMKAMHAAKRLAKENGEEPAHPIAPLGEPTVDIQSNQQQAQMQKQIDEIMETNALLKAALLGQSNNNGSNDMQRRGNQIIGETEKYLIDPSNYPDPTKRLREEPRLKPLAFDYNYDLDYVFEVTSYETKTGLNMKEPKFNVTLNRIVLDAQGEQTNKRYIARKLIFHEDPQAALVIARENNLDVDKSDEKTFLDEMRYIRVRDWLFGIFWPKPVVVESQIRDEVIGGSIVQVFTKSSEQSSAIDFDQLNTKI